MANITSLLNTWAGKIKSALTKKHHPSPAPITDPDPESEHCCEGRVHIAYRGLSDDRLYVAYNRAWREVRFFRPNGLRVFCSSCRRRVL